MAQIIWAGFTDESCFLGKKSFRRFFHTSTLHNQHINDFAPVVERSVFNKRHGVVEVRGYFLE